MPCRDFKGKWCEKDLIVLASLSERRVFGPKQSRIHGYGACWMKSDSSLIYSCALCPEGRVYRNPLLVHCFSKCVKHCTTKENGT